MRVFVLKQARYDLISLVAMNWRKIALRKCIVAICLAAALPLTAQNVIILQSHIGTVGGTVQDVNGGVVPGAVVTLQCALPCRSQSTSSSDLGGFEFNNVALGIPYRVVVTASGFKEWTSSTVLLKADQRSVLLKDVRVQAIDASSSVTVYASQEEIATEQVHLEEKQRVLGVIPNFYVVYDSKDAVPLSTKLKFKLAMRVAVDPVTISGVAVLAGIRQATDTPNYVQGAKGYGQRFGAITADGFSDIMIGGAVLPSLLHQDPRYFYQGTGTTASRLKHALFSPFVCRGDNGKPQVNFSSLGGDLAASALSNTYYPNSNRGPGLVFGNFAIGTGERMLSAVIQEFVLRKLTPSAKSRAGLDDTEASAR
jgi:Carboxypeptidase regulatory-like domain